MATIVTGSALMFVWGFVFAGDVAVAVAGGVMGLVFFLLGRMDRR